jgi:CheY-like chemotaxis protein
MPPVRGLRILVVDDYGDVGAMLSELLRGKGHDTRVANDGPTALQIAQRFKPDVAFLDIGLPVMNGYELARRLKALPGLAALRLIAITGHGQPADRQKAEAAGFSNHLVKPIDFDLLEKLLSEGE